MIERRGLLKLFGGLVLAPAVVRAESLMPVKLWVPPKPRVTRIVGAKVYYNDGRWLAWEAVPGKEIIVLPGQDINTRFDQCVRFDRGNEIGRDLLLEANGRLFVHDDAKVWQEVSA